MIRFLCCWLLLFSISVNGNENLRVRALTRGHHYDISGCLVDVEESALLQTLSTETFLGTGTHFVRAIVAKHQSGGFSFGVTPYVLGPGHELIAHLMEENEGTDPIVERFFGEMQFEDGALVRSINTSGYAHKNKLPNQVEVLAQYLATNPSFFRVNSNYTASRFQQEAAHLDTRMNPWVQVHSFMHEINDHSQPLVIGFDLATEGVNNGVTSAEGWQPGTMLHGFFESNQSMLIPDLTLRIWQTKLKPWRITDLYMELLNRDGYVIENRAALLAFRLRTNFFDEDLRGRPADFGTFEVSDLVELNPVLAQVLHASRMPYRDDRFTRYRSMVRLFRGNEEVDIPRDPPTTP